MSEVLPGITELPDGLRIVANRMGDVVELGVEGSASTYLINFRDESGALKSRAAVVDHIASVLSNALQLRDRNRRLSAIGHHVSALATLKLTPEEVIPIVKQLDPTGHAANRICYNY